MARRRTPAERKLRTREHVLADLSVNYVEKQALLCGFSAMRVQPDYGIDLMVQTFNRHGEVETGWLLFQLKGTDRIKDVGRGQALSCRVERAHLRPGCASPSRSSWRCTTGAPTWPTGSW